MTASADVERAIVDDESMLERVVGLLESGTGISGWPEDARNSLSLALHDGSMSSAEAWKAVTLRRHLFGQVEVPEQIAPVQEPSAAMCRYGQILRAGLPARVRSRVAAYMLPAAE